MISDCISAKKTPKTRSEHFHEAERTEHKQNSYLEGLVEFLLKHEGNLSILTKHKRQR